jgi:hypothetical protein
MIMSCAFLKIYFIFNHSLKIIQYTIKLCLPIAQILPRKGNSQKYEEHKKGDHSIAFLMIIPAIQRHQCPNSMCAIGHDLSL